jgi:hypothetical protein
MGDEVCEYVVKYLLKRSFSCRDFASMGKIIEMGQPVTFLTRMMKQSKNMRVYQKVSGLSQ